jgi:hypothetical protein
LRVYHINPKDGDKLEKSDTSVEELLEEVKQCALCLAKLGGTKVGIKKIATENFQTNDYTLLDKEQKNKIRYILNNFGTHSGRSPYFVFYRGRQLLPTYWKVLQSKYSLDKSGMFLLSKN